MQFSLYARTVTAAAVITALSLIFKKVSVIRCALGIMTTNNKLSMTVEQNMYHLK